MRPPWRLAVPLGLLLSFLVGPVWAHAAFPGRNGRIAYEEIRGCMQTAWRGMYRIVGAVLLLLAIAPATPAAAAGELDSTFAGDGKLIADFGAQNDGATDVASQPDGRIVVATGSGLVRHTPAGALDPSFSGDGRVPGASYQLAIQRDGRILATSHFGVARYRSDGTLDPSFSGDGRVEIPNADQLAVGLDGKVIVSNAPGNDEDFITRLRGDGSPDTSFSGDGTVLVREPDASEWIAGLAAQADGRVVLAEGFRTIGEFGFIVRRYTADGKDDPSFGEHGVVDPREKLSNSNELVAESVEVQGDGKIVVVATTLFLAGAEFPFGFEIEQDQFAVARLNPDGSFDRSFSRDGKQLVGFGGDVNGALGGNGADAALQSGGGIVLGGYTNPLDRPTTDFALARLRPDGSLSGKAVTSLGRNDGAGAVAIQRDGRILAAGSTGPPGRPDEFSFPNPDNLALARYRTMRIDRPRARLEVRRRQRLARVFRRGLVFRLRTQGLVRGSVRLVAAGRSLGHGRPRIYRRGSTRVRVRLSRRAKRRLLQRRGGMLVLRVRLINAEGTSRLLRARVRVR